MKQDDFRQLLATPRVERGDGDDGAVERSELRVRSSILPGGGPVKRRTDLFARPRKSGAIDGKKQQQQQQQKGSKGQSSMPEGYRDRAKERQAREEAEKHGEVVDDVIEKGVGFALKREENKESSDGGEEEEKEEEVDLDGLVDEMEQRQKVAASRQTKHALLESLREKQALQQASKFRRIGTKPPPAKRKKKKKNEVAVERESQLQSQPEPRPPPQPTPPSQPTPTPTGSNTDIFSDAGSDYAPYSDDDTNSNKLKVDAIFKSDAVDSTTFNAADVAESVKRAALILDERANAEAKHKKQSATKPGDVKMGEFKDYEVDSDVEDEE